MTCTISYLITWTLKERIYLTLVYCINRPTLSREQAHPDTQCCVLTFVPGYIALQRRLEEKKSLKTESGSCMNQESDIELIFARSSLGPGVSHFSPSYRLEADKYRVIRIRK